ncbi:MAG: dephospho-CoA kinase [Candidatus Cyclobacteriaceae bacterium M2_1C_046]
MSQPLKIGVTGGIGSGKSLVCRIFSKLGVPVYYADDRAKWLMANDADLKSKIIAAFGSKSYNPDSTLNRSYLSKKAFNDPEQLKKLNNIVHPAVGQDFKNFSEANQDKKYIIKEAALIFESGAYKNLDFTINIYASERARVERVLKRDPQRDSNEIKAIIDKQLKDEERSQLSDFEIKNDGEHLIIPQVLDLHHKFLSL